MSIHIEQLKKYYGLKRGIEDVSLDVESGEFYGFIGPNGAGKSTTLRVLINLLFPTSGHATILGRDVTQDAVVIKQDLGYLPAEVNLYPDMSVKDLVQVNIRYYASLKRSASGFCALTPDERVHQMTSNRDMLTALLQVDLTKKFGELSSGNQKKVGYILSVLHDPHVILLDEPTNGLDPLIKDKLFEDLKNRQARGATVFFSSHNLDEIERYCSKVAFIKEGQIIQVSTIESLKSLSLKNVQFKVPIDQLDHVRQVMEQQFVITKVESNLQSAIFYMTLTDGIKSALQTLLQFELLDLTIESPSLEEIFKYYY